MGDFGALRDGLDGFLTSHLAGLENDQRLEALAWYCQGLGFETEAKTALGLAASMNPEAVQGTRQRMQRAIAQGRFEAETIFERLQQTVFESGNMQAYCVDDTGIAKKGDLSVGVQRQYSGTLGKVGNCQVVVSLHGVSDTFGACLGLQLYLPESWCEDPQRREDAKIPSNIEFKKKWQIAAGLLEAVIENDGPRLPVLADAAYGDSREFREHIKKLGLHYAVAVSSQMAVWRAETRLEVPSRKGPGPAPSQPEAVDGSSPIMLATLAEQLERTRSFKRIAWRRGTKGPLESDFAAIRIRSAERHTKGQPPGDEEWLVIEREKKASYKYYLASLSRRASLKSLVRLLKMRWHIERDYQDMKQQLGFDRYEGRSWGGLHRHLALVALMHAFIGLHLEDFSPSSASEHMVMG